MSVATRPIPSGASPPIVPIAPAAPRLSPLVALLFILLIALYAFDSAKSIRYGYTHDFLNFFTGGSFARDLQFQSLYDIHAQQLRQHEIQPDNPTFTWFMRPPFGALLFAPFAWMPYDTAFRVFLASQYLGLAAFLWWAFRRFGQHALLWCAFSPVAVFAIGEGQDSVVLLLLALGAFLLFERGLACASGFLLGLMLIKFHLFLLVPLAILAQRRWRMLAGYSSAAALQALVAWVALGGIGGILRYVTFLRTMQKSDPHPMQQISIFGLAQNFHLGLPAIAAGILLVTALVVYIALHGSPWQWFAAAMVGSMILPPHVWEYDATALLLPALFGIFSTRDWAIRIPSMLIVCPFIYLSKIAGPPFTAAASITLIWFVVALAANVWRHAPPLADREEPLPALQPTPVTVD